MRNLGIAGREDRGIVVANGTGFAVLPEIDGAQRLAADVVEWREAVGTPEQMSSTKRRRPM